MKKLALVVTIIAILLCGCSGSDSSSSSASDPVVSDNNTRINNEDLSALFDPDTELQTGIRGFAVEKIYIIDGNDEKISGSEVALNTKFSIVYEGVKNYTGKAFPSLALQVSDDNGNMIMSETDLFASYVDGVSEADASVLRATITVGSPMKPGNYICSIQVTDKNNSEAGITSTWSFEVK